MSRSIRAVPALYQAVFVARLRVGKRTDHGTDMQGSIWNNKVPFDWLAVHKNGTSSCLSCSMGLYNQLLIKVAFWNWNSKTRLPHLSISLCFFICLVAFSWLYLWCSHFWWVAIKVHLHAAVRSFLGGWFMPEEGHISWITTYFTCWTYLKGCSA